MKSDINGQIDIFDVMYPTFKIDKPVRLIELFGGYGSQAMALKRNGVQFEHYRLVEFDKYAIKSYNAVHGTEFDIMDIREVKGKDLGVEKTDLFDYIMCYSFPCTDLSVAGKMKGMSKGSGTRSGLLWEVERLITEMDELPQVLLMENVPQVIADANIKDFNDWQSFLESKGYVNYVDTLNAKDYGVAQNRERTFMVSLLGNYNYKFPQSIKLEKTMDDYLEDVVDEKYYIKSDAAQKLINQLIGSNELSGRLGNINPSQNGMNGNVFATNGLAPTLTTNKGEGQRICVDLSNKNPKTKNISNCLTARENRGISNQASIGTGVLETYNEQSKIIVASRGRNPNNPSDRTVGSKVEQRLEPNIEGICNALTTVAKDNYVLETAILCNKQTEYGKTIRKSYESGTVQDNGDTCPTLTAQETGVCRIEYRNNKQLIGNTNVVCETRTDELRMFDDNICGTIRTIDAGGNKAVVESDLRIRKLIPRECGRLMDVSDEDITNMLVVNSDSQCYKQFGNSIVVSILQAIFKQMF